MKQNQEILVKSPANIAFIKYWGQRDERIILPYNDSFSMNLSNCFTMIRLEKKKDKNIQELYIKEYKGTNYIKTEGIALQKVQAFYQRVKKFLHVTEDFGFAIYSENSFPQKAGIASSASFFSGLALAFVTGFEKKLSQKQLSILARLSGSGSACRSIPDGFCWWKKGISSETSFAASIGSSTYWDLVDLVLLVTFEEKKISSIEGHKNVTTSSYFRKRLADVKKRLPLMKKVFIQKDFATFGKLLENEAISMHTVMMTQSPPLYFWSGATIEVMKKTMLLREKGIPAYFTIDAGENVHIICQKKDEQKICAYFRNQPEVKEIISSYPTIGTRIITK